MAASGSRTKKKQPSRRGHIIMVCLGAGSVLAAGGFVTFRTAMSERLSASMVTVEDQLPDHVVLAGALLEAGISPEALAVAGLTSQQASAVIDAALEAARPRITQLRIALNSKHAAQRQVTKLRREGGASSSAIQTARENATSTSQTHASLVALVSSPALAQMDTAQQRRLAASRTNAGRDLPLKYGAYQWTPSEASAISQASRQKSANESRGEAVDAETAAVLSRADANSDVSVASQSIEARLAAIQAIWDTAVRADD